MTYTPQVWPSLYLDQRVYIRNLIEAIETAEAQTLPLTIQKSTEPSQAEFEAAWASLRPDAPTIPDYGKMQWFNPAFAQLENSYVRLPEAGGILVDTDHKNRDLPLVLLGSDVAAVTNDTDLTVSNIDQTYRDLLIFLTAHSTRAVTGESWLFRVNAGATLYYYQTARQVGATFVAAEGLNQAQVPIVVPGASLATDANSWIAAFIHIRDYANAARITFGDMQNVAYTLATGATAVQAEHTAFIRNSAGAVTSVSVTPTTASTVEKGSSLLVYGLK